MDSEYKEMPVNDAELIPLPYTDESCEQLINDFAKNPQSARHLRAMYKCFRAAGIGPKEALRQVCYHYSNVLKDLTKNYEASN